MNYLKIIDQVCAFHDTTMKDLNYSGTLKSEVIQKCILRLLVIDLRMTVADAAKLMDLADQESACVQIPFSMTNSTYYSKFFGIESRLNHKRIMLKEQYRIASEVLLEITGTEKAWDEVLRKKNNYASRLKTVNTQLKNIEKGLPMLGEQEKLTAAGPLPKYMNY
jgi:hypothetical protein